SDSMGPITAKKLPEFGSFTGPSPKPGPTTAILPLLPDCVHPKKSPLSKPQFMIRLPAIASQTLGTAAAGAGNARAPKTIAQSDSSETPQAFVRMKSPFFSEVCSVGRFAEARRVVKKIPRVFSRDPATGRGAR